MYTQNETLTNTLARKSMPDRPGLIWVKFPTVRKNARGMPGEWEVLELAGK